MDRLACVNRPVPCEAVLEPSASVYSGEKHEIGVVCGQCGWFNQLANGASCASCQHDLSLRKRKTVVVSADAPHADLSALMAATPTPTARFEQEKQVEPAKHYVCRSCSSAVPAGHKFCGRCGTPVPAEIRELKTN